MKATKKVYGVGYRMMDFGDRTRWFASKQERTDFLTTLLGKIEKNGEGAIDLDFIDPETPAVY